MRTAQKSTGLPSTWGLILIAVLAACGSDSSNGQTVAVNLSLIVDARQAQHRPAVLTAVRMDRTLVSRRHTRLGAIRHGNRLDSGSNLRDRAYPHPPQRPFPFLIRQRSRDSCEHPSAGRPESHHHGDCLQCGFATSEDLRGNATRRELDRWGANRSRDHARAALYGYRAKRGRWQWHCDLLPSRHRLRRHLRKPVSRGHDRSH